MAVSFSYCSLAVSAPVLLHLIHAMIAAGSVCCKCPAQRHALQSVRITCVLVRYCWQLTCAVADWKISHCPSLSLDNLAPDLGGVRIHRTRGTWLEMPVDLGRAARHARCARTATPPTTSAAPAIARPQGSLLLQTFLDVPPRTRVSPSGWGHLTGVSKAPVARAANRCRPDSGRHVACLGERLGEICRLAGSIYAWTPSLLSTCDVARRMAVSQLHINVQVCIVCSWPPLLHQPL